MQIIKLDHKKEENSQSLRQHTKKLSLLKKRNHQTQCFSKKNSLISQRNLESQADEQLQNRKYTPLFSKMMNKILHRIYRRNNFFKTEESEQNHLTNSTEMPKEEVSHLTQSLDYPNRKNKTFYQPNKLKIKGVGRTQNDSNLLKRQKKLQIFSQTSASFTGTKQFKKSQFRKTKSLSSEDYSTNKFIENRKQNSFILKNTPYSPKEFSRLMVQESFKIGPFVPKITAKENYQQMHQLFRGDIESRKNKIEIGKKNFHKKMMQKQRKNQKFNIKQNVNVFPQMKDAAKSYEYGYQEKFNHIQPWYTNEEYNQEIFRVSKKKTLLTQSQSQLHTVNR